MSMLKGNVFSEYAQIDLPKIYNIPDPKPSKSNNMKDVKNNN